MAGLLFTEFCNHIYLGQWELARASALNLIKSDSCSDESKIKLISTIRSISKDPYLACSAWSSLPCPSFVNLLSQHLLSDLCYEDDKEQRHRIDFNILLEMVLRSPESILKELSCIFDEVAKVKRNSKSINSYSNFEITNECVTALKISFKENPSQVSLILSKLCLPDQMKFSLNSVFCNMFFQLILNSLKSAESSFSKRENATLMKNLLFKIYLLLSLLPSFLTDSNKDIEHIFLYCIELSELEILKTEKIYTSLLGCSSSTLLKYFCKLEDNKSGNKESEKMKSMISKCSFITAEGNFHHRKALLWSIHNGSHFLQYIMEHYVENILSGNWESIKGEINHMPSQLKSLFLLLSWEKCTDDVSSMNVIKAIKMWHENVEDPVLEAACRKFRLNISLSEICISNYKTLFPSSEPAEIQSQLWRILTCLQTQSLLRVLHSVFGLKNIPPDKLENMLKQSQEYLCDSDMNLSSVLTDEAIYSGYIVMVLVMEAIYLCCEFKDVLESKQMNLSSISYKRINELPEESVDSKTECKTCQTTSLSAYMNKHGCQEAYSKFIVEKLETARQKLKNLFPLFFRVEILENIFSVLFLMVKNLVDLTEPSYDSDQGHEGESQLLDRDDSFSTYSVDMPEKKLENKFIISTMKLKDSIMLKNDTSENFSGHISSKSSESTCSNGYQPHTFLCNELIARDLLSLLKDSLLEAKAEIYKLIGWHDPNVTPDATSKIPSFPPDSKISDSYNELPERTSRLLQYVNEAIWRYEVVQRDIFQERISFIDRHKNKPHLLQSQCSTSSSEGTDREIKKHRKRKKHKHSHSSQKDESVAESSIIQCMLSSPEALLRYSLWNGNLTQAGQVIKLFNLQSSDEAKELTLINELQHVCNKLLAYDKTKEKSMKKGTSVADDKAVSSSISTIKNAASFGLHTSSLYMTIHQELSGLRVLQVMDITGRSHHPELLLGSENIYSIFLIDLACVSDISIELASSLLDSADKSWTSVNSSCKDFDVKTQLQKKAPLIRGNSQILHMINSLLKEFLFFFKENFQQTDLCSLFWPVKKDFTTVPQVLPYFVGNLNHTQFKDEVNNWKNICCLIKEFSVLLDREEMSQEKTALEKDIKHENKLHMTYKKLSRSLRELREWSSVTISSEITYYNDYLSKLFIHLRQVTTAALECKNQNISTGQTIYTSDFSILKESPVELLKKIILQTGITPEKIEIFAVRMKVDLVRVLAQACLPYVPLLKGSICVDKLLRSSCKTQHEGYPKYILNMARQDWPKPRHPDLVARELLRDVISMLQETALANNSCGIFKAEELISLTNHSQLSSWMDECSELAFVDLDLLQTREEKLAFFINVTNIGWLYAILFQTMLGKTQEKEEEHKSPDYTESNGDDTTDFSQELLLSSNSLERFTVQKILGFSIGQLGPISLFDLRYQLLRAQLPVPKHLEAAPFHKLFDDKNSTWDKYMPVLETRLLFVLVEGLLFSPKLQVIYSEDIDDTLEKAMRDYFDFTIHVDVEKDSVILPQLLQWYALDFSKDEENCFDKAPYEGLINLLSTLVRSPLSEQFQELLSEDSAYNFSENIDSSGKKQLPFTLEFSKSPAILGIMLEYCPSSMIQPDGKKTSLMDPQPIIINYLKEKCSILTDLYAIIISENPSQYLSELNFNIPVFNLLKYYNSLNVLLDEKFAWFSSALSPTPNRKYFSQQIEFCFFANMWHQALLYLDIYLEYNGKHEYNLELARQLILEHISCLNPSTSASEPSNYALCISDPLCRAKAVLQNVHKWTEHSALKALKYCLSDSKISDFPEVHQSLKNKFKEITLYKKVVDASEIYGSSEAKDCVYVFNNWQEVADCSVWDQSRIFDFLNSCEKYDLAVEWLELNVVNRQEKITALSMNLLWYLLQDPPNEKALKILDSLENPDCLKLCDIVLPKLSSVEAKLCLVQYLVNNVPAENQQYYYNMFLGLKMLSALKSPARETYADLVAHPYLILEQMLMNVQLKDAEKAIKAVVSDIESLSDIVPVINKANVNQLVEDYASKALEVHFLDALLDTSSSSTLVLSMEDSMVSDEPFVMPARVPTKEEWVPDAKIHRCQVCKEERFNMFTRRHHCRRCGRVVCANCSQHALIVEGYGNVKVRVCEECYNLMTGSISVTSSSFDKRYRILSSMQSSPRNSPYQESISPRRRASSIHQAFRWVLSSDSEQNASVRNEFAYEQAPSISLCFSILKLHSDSKKCAQFMLNLCDRLLGKIKPRRSGKIPVEIDYSLIISMIKSLLVSAKVTCHQVLENEGEALADLYFQHLDIMKLLVNANCRHLLPREALTNSTDTVRKLRDKLLEEERMSLALEVSTKFSLDKTGVWSSWGLFCIRAGDLPSARTKFQQCLKVISDKNDPKQESPLLNKILKMLENSKHAGTEKAAAIYKSLSHLKNIESGNNWLKNENSTMDELIQKECLYYLNAYGTHFSTVRFYQRNSLTCEALNYIINKKCEPEIFIEAIFMPMLKNVQLSSLKHDLTKVDPSLSAWWNYLLATCRYLERLKYLNVLYEIQLFMEDYARAAKSAINFYLAPASSYRILFERLRYLYNAKKHYQKCLRDWKEVDTSSLTQKNKNVKILSPKEVERYIEIITLQEEVTRFCQLCISQSNQATLIEIPAVEKTSERSYPPTLFGNSQKKAQVALMVILNAVNIDEGFELAIKIIQTFGLDTTAILCEAGKELVIKSQKVQIPHFLACVKCFFSRMIKVDQVILECVSEIHKQKGEVEDIIKMLTSDIHKINAYLMCDKLKSAYLLAIKLKSALDVRRVLVAAEQSGQSAIQQICKRWLESNSESK